jgi:hypothetical protein
MKEKWNWKEGILKIRTSASARIIFQSSRAFPGGVAAKCVC